jgi:hypothetical protein
VPKDATVRHRILWEHYDASWAGQRGVARTLELVSRLYWWPSLRRDVVQHVRTCDTCQHVKPSSRAQPGLLQPLSVPEARWESVFFDLVTGLAQTTRGFNAILAFVDPLTTYVHLVPTMDTLTACGFASLLMQHVFANHGMLEVWSLIVTHGGVTHSGRMCVVLWVFLFF